MKSLVCNQKGISLIEIIVSVAIAGIIMISMMAMMKLMSQNSARIAMNVTKNEVITRIRLNALNLTAVQASAELTKALGIGGMQPDVGTTNNFPNAEMLANCMPNVGSSSTCDKTTMDDPRGFKFYLSNGTSTDPLTAVAGEDIYYTTKGIRCTSDQAAIVTMCPIKTSVWAEPYCTGFSATCSKAISLTIRFRVEVRPDFTGEVLMSPIEGEVYLTLTKGIQLSRLLTQVDNPVQLNSAGIYTVQKYYGYNDQSTQPTGLRFEAILGNPIGLVSMKLQYRALTGTSVNSYLDDTVPAGINSLPWIDVDDPLVPGTPWEVQLGGAKANQIINFGTQTTATTAYNTVKSYRIGALESDSISLRQKYRWTIDGSGNLVAPEFKSGFYQFRILATDSSAATMESINSITVRIVPRPQFLIPATSPATAQIRNCITAQKTLTYKVGVADDEGLGVQTLTLNGIDEGFTSVSGTYGFIEIPFDLSQDIGTVNKTFGYAYTAKNKFFGKTINYFPITATSESMLISLSEKPVNFLPITSSPSKIRIDNVGTATASFETGSCCSEDPTVSWTYPSVPEVSAPLLSGPATSTPICTIDTTTNKRSCSASVVVTGIKESPNATSSPDLASQITFSVGNNACTGGTATLAYPNNTYIPVIKVPGIQFYLGESLWLNIPTNPIPGKAPKSISPTVYIRSDFDPDQDVTVGVYKSDNSLVCSHTFTTGVGTNPIDHPCAIPAGYSGDLTLKRISSNIMLDTDTPDASFRAKLVSGKLNHRTCQANLNTAPTFADITVSPAKPMLNSPWGFTEVGSTKIQDPNNDTGLWPQSASKKLRCYDSWNGTLGAVSYNNSDLQTIPGFSGPQDINVQDVYKLDRYNKELKPNGSANLHNGYGTILYPPTVTISKSRYQTFVFPENPTLDFDPQNAPYVFMVYHDGGSPTNAVWQFVNPNTSASGITPPKPWTDYTSQLCTGSAELSTIKLFGIKTVGHVAAETTMQATNNIVVGNNSGVYSYTFMCSFGRWNPFKKDIVTPLWTD